MARKEIIKLFIFSFFLLAFNYAFSADLYLSPSSGKYNLGQNFSIAVYVSSPDREINAVSTYLSFDPDVLQVVSLSQAGSLVKFWAQEPKFSNTQGTISFEGVIFNPAFKGNQGKVLTINFRGKNIGSTEINFTSASVLANDGKGTDVLKNFKGANIEIIEKREIVEREEKETPIQTAYLPTPQIKSPTHPDQNKWYFNKLARFIWNVPSMVEEVKTLLGQNPAAYPVVSYSPPINSKEVEIPFDGIWYFSAQFCNEFGCSDVGRHKIQIDSTKPEINLKEIEREDLTDPRVKIYIDAKDSLSGIDYYLININGIEEKWYDDGTHIYQPKNLKPGNYNLKVKVFDKAGNFNENSISFVIKPLDPPIITEYAKSIIQGEPLVVKGKTKYPDVKVYVYLETKDGIMTYNETKADKNKNFAIAINNLSVGNYKAFAILRDEIGRESLPSEYINFVVRFPYVIELFGFSVNILYLIFILLLIILILIVLVVYYLYSLMRLRHLVRSEADELHRSIDHFIHYLSLELEKQADILRKARNVRQLTEEENKTLEEIEQKLEKFKKYLHREIKDLKDLSQ